VSVEQNIPQEENNTTNGLGLNSEKHNRSEKTLNYEINSKVTSTVRSGYSIDKLDVAVVIDRGQLLRSKDKNGDISNLQHELDKRLASIKNMLIAAAGIDSKRGDLLN